MNFEILTLSHKFPQPRIFFFLILLIYLFTLINFTTELPQHNNGQSSFKSNQSCKVCVITYKTMSFTTTVTNR